MIFNKIEAWLQSKVTRPMLLVAFAALVLLGSVTVLEPLIRVVAYQL